MIARTLAFAGLSALAIAALGLVALCFDSSPATTSGDERSKLAASNPATLLSAESATIGVTASESGELAASSKDTGTTRPGEPVNRPGIDEFLLFPTSDRALTREQAWDLVNAARSGNLTAQVSLGRQLGFCKVVTRSYPDSGALEEYRAQAMQSDVALGEEFWHELQNQLNTCWRLQHEVVGAERYSTEWLRRAATENYGPALAFLAESRLIQFEENEDGTPNFRSDPAATRALFDAAARTRHPQALFAIGLNMSLNDGEYSPFRGQNGTDGLQWIYTACRFGLDCSHGNNWLQTMCRMGSNCDAPYARNLTSFVEYILFTGVQRDVAVANAPELIQLIESGEWDRLHLTQAGDPSVEEVLAEIAEPEVQESSGGE